MKKESNYEPYPAMFPKNLRIKDRIDNLRGRGGINKFITEAVEEKLKKEEKRV